MWAGRCQMRAYDLLYGKWTLDLFIRHLYFSGKWFVRAALIVGLVIAVAIEVHSGYGRAHPALAVSPQTAKTKSLTSGCSAADIDTFLQNSPLAGTGSAHLAAAQQWDVDPRLIVAISGAESSFGRNICAAYNAWNWFYGGDCPNSPFSSWEEGINTVTRRIRQLYFDTWHLYTIHDIGQTYCGSGCENWEPNVRYFYAAQGGDPDTNDLSFTGACAGTKPPPALNFTVLLKNVPSGNQSSEVAVVVQRPLTKSVVWGPVIVTTNNDGYYLGLTLSGVQSGVYDVCAKPGYRLGLCARYVSLSPDTTTYIDFSQNGANPSWPGDVDNYGQDNVVNSLDSAVFIAEFRRCPPFSDCNTNHRFDFNRDGVLNLNDYSLLLATWQYSPRGEGSFANVYGSQQEMRGNIEGVSFPESLTFLPSFTLSAVREHNVGDEFNLFVTICSFGVDSHGADAILHYDPGVLEVMDADPSTPGIQVSVEDVYPNITENTVDPATGLIRVSASIGNSTETFDSVADWFTVRLRVIAATAPQYTGVSVQFEDDETTDSNIAEDGTGLDALFHGDGIAITLHGSPYRTMPTISITPESGSYINEYSVPVIANVDDPYNQVESVEFWAYYDDGWHRLGVDREDSDGWSVVWDTSSISDQQEVKIVVDVDLPGDLSASATNEHITLDRTPPSYLSSSFTPSSPSSASTVSVQVSANDDLSGPVSVEMYVNTATGGSDSGEWVLAGALEDASAGSIEWNTLDWADGDHLVIFTLWDSAGNFRVEESIYTLLPRIGPGPDLRPYAPSGYPYPVVPSSIKGTHEVNTLYAGKSTYFDWHFINSGDATASGSFHIELWVDDVRYIHIPYYDFGAGWSGGFDDWAQTISTPGWHTVRLITDPDDTVAESDETNNVWEQQFYWESVTGWWGEYFNNETLSDDPVLVRDDPEIDFDWQDDSPGPGVNSDHFSARWTRSLYLDGGTYIFHVFRDDGARLWIDDTLVLDEWRDGREEHTVEVELNTGSHDIRFEMYEIGGWAAARLWWERIVEPVANDDFDLPLCVGWPDRTYTQQTEGATVALDDPVMSCIDNQQGAVTVWYRFVSPDSGVLHLDTFGSDYDTVLAVYTGDRGNLFEVDCDDDTQGLQSALDIPVVAGEAYHVQVAGYPGSSGGSLQLSVEYTPPPGCSQFMQNGSFEQGPGSCPWWQSSSGGYELIDTLWPRGGSYSAWFGGYDNANDVMFQVIRIPDNATSTTLTFWWYMSTTEAGASSDVMDSSKISGPRTQGPGRDGRSPQSFGATPKSSEPHDYLDVWLYDSASAHDALLQRITDQSTQGTWTLSRAYLEVGVGGAYILGFTATTDASNWTNFFVDDVSLVACTSCAFDFDGSGAVDTADIMRVASRWRTSCAKPDPDNDLDTPNYDPLYDVDEDCKINIVDIMKVVARWGPCE